MPIRTVLTTISECEVGQWCREFIGGIDTVAVDPACDLIDSIVAANVLGVADGRALLTQNAAVDRAGLKIKRGHGVDLVGHLVKPGRAHRGLW